MSFNGSGTFLINSTGQPVVANTVISATVFNALTADLASGLTNCITKDGQSTPTANIPMGSNKITGLANGTLIGDAANLGQVQSTVAKLISITGTDTVLGTMSPTLTAYAAGQLFYFIASGANTGAVTLNIDGLGAKAITRDGSTALAAGDINSGEIVVVIYDGTRFQMINAANSFGNTTINGTLTVTGNTGLQANVSVTSALSVGGTFAVTGAATLGSTLAVTGKSDLPTVSTASANAAVAVITDLSVAGASITSANVGTAVVTTGTVTNLTATSASVASVNAGVALLTTATVTNLTATGASIASANLGNAVISALTLTGVSVASANVGVANITDLRAVGASVTSANLGTAVVTNGTVTNLTATSASVASVNAAVALLTTATVTTLTASGASIASANIGNLQFTAASIASINAGVAVINNLTATSASIASANVGTAVITTGTVTSLTATGASVASANVGTAVVTGLTVTGASIASMNGVTANITTVNATTVDATNVEVTNVKAKDGTAAITIADSTGLVTAGAGVTLSGGNLTFSSTAQRITGDMSNATIANRLAFQNSVTNGATHVNILPNGTSVAARLQAYNNSDPTNSAFISVSTETSEVTIASSIRGTGTYLPMTFYTGGSERVRIDTSGNLLVGTSGQIARLGVVNPTGGYGFAIQGQATDGQSILSSMDRSGTVYTGNITFPEDGSILFGRLNTGSQTTRMTIDSSGNVGIGGTAGAATKLNILGTLPTSGTVSFGVGVTGTIPSGSTSGGYGFSTGLNTEAASFTLGELRHFSASQATIGAGSTVTNQFGFIAGSNLTGATNNFGFYSDIASGSNRWNFYAAGTAQNYFAGDVGVGRTPAASTRLSIKGQNNGSGTFSVYVENSTPTEMFKIRDDGLFYTGVASSSPYNATTANAANVEVDANGILRRSTSSLRYKSDVVNATHGLSDVLKLRSVTYRGKNDGDKVLGGLIAEEVHDAGLTEFVAYDKEGRPDALHYGNMVALLVKAVQELTARVAELEAK